MFCSFVVQKFQPTRTKTTCFEFSMDGDSLNSYTFDANVYDMINDENDEIILCGAFDDYDCQIEELNLQIAKMDTLLNINNVICVNDKLFDNYWPYCHILNDNGKFVIAGVKSVGINPTAVYTGIFDTDGKELLSTSIGDLQEQMYSSYYKGIAKNNNDEIFVYGTWNYIGYTFFSPIDNYIVVSKMDTLLNKEWEVFIGGDAYYDAYNILACEDGGVLISTTRYDENVNNEEWDACYFKLDANGQLTGIEDETMQVKQAIVYPNPAQDFINIRLGGHIQNATIEIYDLSGKKMHTENLQTTETQINISRFVSGTYVYKIYTDSKTIDSGKFVKE